MNCEIVFIAEAGALEQQGLLLCESIRQFGGIYSSSSIKILQPRSERRIGDGARARFAAMDAEIVEMAIVSPRPEYGPTYRIFACAEYERISRADVLIFLDSDTLLLAEPDFELANHDAALRPVDVKGMCTTGAGDSFDPYWRDLCRVCGVDYDSLPEVTTTVDRVRVKASYNGGLTVVKRLNGLFGKTAGFFQKSLDAGLVPWPNRNATFAAGHGMVSAEGGNFWGSSQAALSLAISALGLSVRILPASQNFPLPSYDAWSSEIDAGAFPILAHVHYHHLLSADPRHNPILAGKPGFPAGSARWLRGRMNADKHLIVVLGMHRSGTSALARSLQAFGVDLGSNFHPITADNPKGHWEDKDFQEFNEEMLKHRNRSWDDLPWEESGAVPPDFAEFFPGALALLDGFLHEKSLAGLKDPRFSVLLPFWKKVFSEAGVRVSFVIGLRNPLSVAASLFRRDGFPKISALWLWVLYSVHLAAGMADGPGLVVDYDGMLEQPRAQFERLGRFLGLFPDATSLESFFAEFLNPELCHAHYSAADLRDDPDCDPLLLEIFGRLSDLSMDDSPSGVICWNQAPLRWEHSLRPVRSLLHWNSVLWQKHTALETQAVRRELASRQHLERIKSLEAGNAWLTQKNEEYLERGESLKTGNAWLIQKRDELLMKNADLIRENANLTRENSERIQKNTEHGQEAASLRHKITEMQAGLSWRITAPLRYLARLKTKCAK